MKMYVGMSPQSIYDKLHRIKQEVDYIAESILIVDGESPLEVGFNVGRAYDRLHQLAEKIEAEKKLVKTHFAEDVSE